MDKKKKPKFKIGDTVVITMYGTVGKITDVNFLIYRLWKPCYNKV